MTVRELTCGCLYVAGHQAWAWGVRSGIEPWVRRALGQRLGVEVVWKPATTFPVEVWTWGAGARSDARYDAGLAASSVALACAGALAPAAALGFLLGVTGGSAHLANVLYLVTVPLMALFVALQTKRRAGARSEDESIDEEWAQRSEFSGNTGRPVKERGVP